MRDSTAASYQERILRTLVHIQRNLDGPLSLEELAGIAAFSRFHFHRIFRGMVGESVSYQRIFGAWLPQSGREIRDAPGFEIYLNSPQNTPPEELLTVIHVPVG